MNENKSVQHGLSLLLGIVFGIFLHRGSATDFDVILGQLLLKDFTIPKIMLSAVITGMIGVHFLKVLGLAKLQPKPGALGSTIPGGLTFQSLFLFALFVLRGNSE